MARKAVERSARRKESGTRRSEKPAPASADPAGDAGRLERDHAGSSPGDRDSTAKPKARSRKPAETSPRTSGRRRTKAAASRTTAAPAGSLFLINIIPKALSAEFNQDSEPHLTVNPADPSQIVATAFTPDPTGSTNAPIFISKDGGRSWALNSVVPSTARRATQDITTGFSGTASHLYSGILRVPTGNLELLWTRDAFSTGTMSIASSRSDGDQPFTTAATAAGGPRAGREHVYIGVNDFNGTGSQTATIDQCLDGGVNPPSFAPVRLEHRATSGQDGPQVRPVIHSDGTAYAAYYRWRATTGNPGAGTFVITSADVIVVRDDSWGAGPAPFAALTDPADGLPGLRVVQGVTFQWMLNGTPSTGQQRLGGCLSIATDPNNSSNVYLVYADRPPRSIHTLHLLRSTDRGRTWSTDLLRLDNATNGAVAINSNGVIGVLYQQFKGSQGNPRWSTAFSHSRDGRNWNNLILADVPANNPIKRPPNGFDPYLGDYAHLTAHADVFYGVFSTSNIPDHANFPNGVTYQRNADFASRRLLRLDNTTAVLPSIDPFFFRLSV